MDNRIVKNDTTIDINVDNIFINLIPLILILVIKLKYNIFGQKNIFLNLFYFLKIMS